MSKRAVIIAAATVCAAMVSLRAGAMPAGVAMPAAIGAASPVEKAACGWYPSGYPQSWAVYTPGWGCRYVYPGYYYGAYVYQPYGGVYGSPPRYRTPYWRARTWWWSWY